MKIVFVFGWLKCGRGKVRALRQFEEKGDVSEKGMKSV